ncbi:hypothetical protein B484DRAFT_55067 [Ochromonadaceae sp. CCMP2298]|nr:hypothetical protein B484DRAFT_55067 [Ochromonadaceae sp. CCMP2298]
MNELSLMLFLPPAGVCAHASRQMLEFPSAAAAIRETVLGILRLRAAGREELDHFSEQVQPLLEQAPRMAVEKAAAGEAEGRLGLLYSDLVPKDILAAVQMASLAQQRQDMAHINMSRSAKRPSMKVGRFDSDEEGEEGSSDEESGVSGMGGQGDRGEERARSTSSGNLLGDVIHVLEAQEAQEQQFALAQQAAQQAVEELRTRVGVLAYDGYMEKKSPATNLWQRRWFKIQTRETLDPQNPYTYSFLWFKKEGGAVIKSLEGINIESVSVVSSPRALAYLPLKLSLSLQLDALTEPLSAEVLAEDGTAAGTVVGAGADRDMFVFRILQKDGKLLIPTPTTLRSTC